MGFALVAACAIAASAVYLVLARHTDPLTVAASGSSRPTSPLDEAERILARRYAKAEITAEEYGRMLAIIRR